nr:ribonuclease P protein component [Nitratifractor sp.]
MKRQRDFDAVYRRADKVWHTPSFVLFFKAGKMQASAFVAGKKVGNAVRRNRAKRRLRALFRESEARLVPGIYILVAKAPLLETDFSQLQNDWNTALKRSRALSR